MSNIVLVNNHNVQVKEYNGKRVVTFREIDELHSRTDGTSRRTFYENSQHFIDGEDYFKLQLNEIRAIGIETHSPRGMNLITESGYLLLTKSFTDDLSWEVQKKLVNTYFRYKEMVQAQPEYKLPSNFKEALLQLVEQVEENEKLQTKVLYLEPKAEAFDDFINSDGNLTISEAAKTLNVRGIGRNRLFEILCDEGFIFSKGYGEYKYYESYQQYINTGYFIHKAKTFFKGDEPIKRTQVFVTAKGMQWLAKMLRQRGYIGVA